MGEGVQLIKLISVHSAQEPVLSLSKDVSPTLQNLRRINFPLPYSEGEGQGEGVL